MEKFLKNHQHVSPLVSVIIVNWNGKKLLEECLESLRNQSFRDFEVIVVDNGSTDGSLEFIRHAFPEVRLAELTSNLGFAGGNNAGIGIAKGRYLALLNNDTRADRDWLQNLIGIAEKTPDAGMFASKILSYYKPDIIDNVGLIIYRDCLARGKGRLEEDRGQYNDLTEALMPSGCAALYRKEMIKEIGVFDEEFFAYADDVDIGLRGRLAGWGCLYVPDAVVYHKYSSSTEAYSPLKAFLVERNRIWVMLKYFPVEMILASPYYTAKRLMLQLYGALTGKGASARFSSQYSVFRAVAILLKAWRSAIIALPNVIKQRRRFSGLKRIDRSEIYRLFREFGMTASEVALKE